MILKNNIRAYRTFAGLTQDQLGYQVGLSKNSISSIELGQTMPSAYYAALLCKVFNVTFEKLFYLDFNTGVDQTDDDDTEDYFRHLYSG